MVQLELDPRFLYPERAKEIEYGRSTILRRIMTGGSGDWRKEKRFRPISFDKALSSLLDSSYHHFEKGTDAKGYELDLLVGKTVKRTLPFLQGEIGNFESLSHFKQTMFGSIIRHYIIDRHRRFLRQQGRFNNPDSFPSKEVRESRFNRFNGFQPTLFSPVKRREALFVDKYLSDQFITDLADPERVLNQQLPPHIRRAVHLSVQNGFPSPKVATILETEGFGKFTDSAVRVWLKRFKDKVGGKLPVAHPV